MAHKHPVYDTDKHFVIDPITKKISTECPKVVLPQHSHRSERFTFELPKEVEGHDMSLCNVVEIHFQNIEATNKANKSIGIYKVEDLQTDGDTVFGSWLIDGESTYYVGGLMFAIHFACVADDGTVEYNLPTLSYSAITIGETVWNSETIAKEYPDIVAQFEARILALEQGGGGTGSGIIVSDTAPEDTSALWIDPTDNTTEVPENSGGKSVISYKNPAEVPLESGSQYILYGSDGGTISVQVGSNENNKVDYQLSSGFDVVWLLYVQTSEVQGSIIATSGTRKVINFEGDSSKMKISSTIPFWIVIKVG